MTALTSFDQLLTPTTALSQSLDLPPARHLVHANGCPLYVWWASGRRCSRAGQHWRSWFVYLEYRLADGASAYLQHELRVEAVDHPDIWHSLAQLPLPGACIDTSRQRLICG